MSAFKLTVKPREAFTHSKKKQMKQARKEGWIPAVLYGSPQGESLENKLFFLHGVEFSKVFCQENAHATFHLEDEETLIQDVAYCPISDQVIHVDFLRKSAFKGQLEN